MIARICQQRISRATALTQRSNPTTQTQTERLPRVQFYCSQLISFLLLLLRLLNAVLTCSILRPALRFWLSWQFLHDAPIVLLQYS